MNEDQASLDDFRGRAVLFPLPSLVLFPHVVQGLHIFEPRYRQMMGDALTTDGLLTVILLKPGWEDEYDARPPVEATGCLGRILWHEKLPDGRYNLRLRGLSRVRVTEERPADRPYRVAQTELQPDVVPCDVARLADLRHRLSESVLARFPQAGPAHQHLSELFAGEVPLGHVCDMLAYALPLPLPLKQTLLDETRVDARAELMVRAMCVPAPSGDRKYPPEFSTN